MGNMNCMPAQVNAAAAKEAGVLPYHDFRHAAVQAVTRASQCAAQIQEALVSQDVLIKKDRSPVTVADLAAQIIIIHDLTAAFPTIPFIAEESSRSLNEEMIARLLQFLPAFVPGIQGDQLAAILDKGHAKPEVPPTFCWTIDPVDGTEGYLRREQYAVCVALLEQSLPVVGVLGCPSLPTRLAQPDQIGSLLVAVKGQGCWQRRLGEEREVQCHVAATQESADLVCTESPNTGHSSPHLATIFSSLKIRKSSIKIDSQCKYVLVARGEAGLYLRYSPNYAEKVWDHAAGFLCVLEAGGAVTDVQGKPLDFSHGRTLSHNIGVIASNGKVHPAVAAAVAAVDPVGKDEKAKI